MDTLEPGMSVIDENNGRGTFIGWFQGSVDIAMIKLDNGQKIVVHKRFLTRHYDEPSEKVKIPASADKIRTIATLYDTWKKSPAMKLSTDNPTMAQYAKSRLEIYLAELLATSGVTSADIEDGVYSFDFEEMRFTRS